MVRTHRQTQTEATHSRPAQTLLNLIEELQLLGSLVDLFILELAADDSGQGLHAGLIQLHGVVETLHGLAGLAGDQQLGAQLVDKVSVVALYADRPLRHGVGLLQNQGVTTTLEVNLQWGKYSTNKYKKDDSYA